MLIIAAESTPPIALALAIAVTSAESNMFGVPVKLPYAKSCGVCNAITFAESNMFGVPVKLAYAKS